ncbi:hypothetical protein BGZ72_005129 [Mortierella alpina]|nr:hypothetical protein BGZ72_005129 [Mortierella alpina]
MANGKVFINPKTGYLSNREKALPPPPPRGPVLTLRNPTHGSSSSSGSTPSLKLNKGKGKALAPSISASSSRSNYSHLSYLSVATASSSKAKPFAARSSSKAGVGGSSSAGPSKGKAPNRAIMPSKAGAPAPSSSSYDAGKVKASNSSPCYLTGIGRPKELRSFPGPSRVGPASGADFCTPAGAPQIGLTWMLTKKGPPAANRRPLPLVPPPRATPARARRSFPAHTPSSDRSSGASNRPPDPAKASISSFWLSGSSPNASSPNASTTSVGRTSSFLSIPTITIEDDHGPVDHHDEMLECGHYWYDDLDIEEEDEEAERILTVRNYNDGELGARQWRTSTLASLCLTCSSTDTSHPTPSASSTASSKPSSLRIRTMRARTLETLEGRAPGGPMLNPAAGPIFMPAPTPTPSPPPGPSKFKQFVERQKVILRTVKNRVKWKLQGRTVVRPVARDGPSNFVID